MGSDHSEYRALLDAQKDAARARASAESEDSGESVSYDDAFLEAERLRGSGDTSKALFAYLQALRIDPENQTPRERIAALHLREDPARAESILRGVLADEPDSAFAHAALGLALLAQQRPDEARPALERAVQLDPTSAVAFSALGVVHDQQGLHAAARVYQRRAQQLRPEDPVILNNLGTSCLLDGDLPCAERSFRTAISLKPDDRTLHNNLGVVLGRQRRYGAALASFRRAGDEQAAQNNLGYVHFLNADYDGAIEAYERALLVEGDSTLTILRNLNAALSARSSTPPANAAEPAASPSEATTPAVGPEVQSRAEANARALVAP
jgi:Flp pilus assembly protein TadD